MNLIPVLPPRQAATSVFWRRPLLRFAAASRSQEPVGQEPFHPSSFTLTTLQAHTFLNFFCVLLFNLFIFSLTALQQIIVEDFLYFASFIDIRKNV